jgi:hypothetical protein
MAGPDGIRFTRLAEFLQRILAHRFEQPVARATAALVDDYQ